MKAASFNRTPSTASRPGIPALDGLRGCAALIVLVSHYSNDFGLFGGVLGHGAGQTGVMLFFVLSGFLMAYLHIATDFNAASLWNYAVRRAARVYPLFVVVAAAFMLQQSHAGGGTWFIQWLRQILLIDPGFSVLWTVRVEILFYAAFIGIWLIYKILGRLPTLAGLCAAVIFLSTGSLAYSGLFWASARFFLFGIISALLLDFARTPISRGARIVPILAALLFFSLPLGFPAIIKLVLGVDTQPWHNDFVAAQLALLFNLILRDHGWLNRALCTPAARWLGSISYSLYLLQPFVLQAVAALWPGAPLAFSGAAVLLGALAAASLSRRFIERPMQGWVGAFGSGREAVLF